MRLHLLALLLAACTGEDKPGDDADADGDGYAASEDCDDGNASVHPGATEACDPGDVDEDCSGAADNADPGATGTITIFRDADADGWGEPGSDTAACEAGGGYSALEGDCDDTDPRVSPDGAEICDPADVDEDCDGAADDADDSVDATGKVDTFQDTDGDGYGDAAVVDVYCDAPAGWSLDATDCDDTSATVSPGADETCNGVDDDCDDETDEDSAVDAPTWHLDDDGDSYGDPAATRVQCDQPSGYVVDGTDCDDVSTGVHPGADERCDGEDDDCDGDIDEDDAVDVVTWYQDDDGDGYGDTTSSTIDCDAPTGYVAASGDCDDGDVALSPAATEACDAANTDEDCDGLADDRDAAATGKTGWYADADGDGYGDVSSVTAACDLPAGHVADDSDCDDTDALTNPAGSEICDADDADEDCDGAVDDADTSVAASGLGTWYRDADGDGYGAVGTTVATCDVPAGYAALSTDCDDSSAARSPALAEVCDAANTDEDCDGLADDSDSAATGKTTWYADIDGDGYGDATSSVSRCDASSAYVAAAEDCDDGDGTVNPGELEDCGTTADENCDGIGLCDLVSSDADRAFYGAVNGYVGMNVAGEDLDGDGVDELLTTSSTASGYAGAVYLFTGGGTGDSNVSGADATITGTASMGLSRVSGLGDIDGDGFGDLGLPHPADSTGGYQAGAVYLVRGPVSGSASISSYYAKLNGTAAYDYLNEVTGLGDVDGDGIDDVGIGAAGIYGDGRAYVFTALTSAPTDLASATATFTPESSSGYLGAHVVGIGDSDGDGLEDVVVTDANASGGLGALYLFLGPFSGTVSASAADGKRTGPSGSQVGSYVGPRGGDVDGDGYLDLAVGTYVWSGSENSVWVVPGPLTGTSTISTSTSARIRDTSSYGFGGAVVNDGDFDGDGFADVVVGDTNDAAGGYLAGAVTIYRGPLSGTIAATDADVTISGERYQQLFGSALSYVGPQSGTTDELLVGTYYDSTYGSYAGATYLFSAGSL